MKPISNFITLSAVDEWSIEGEKHFAVNDSPAITNGEGLVGRIVLINGVAWRVIKQKRDTNGTVASC